jgi:hypothetical protein
VGETPFTHAVACRASAPQRLQRSPVTVHRPHNTADSVRATAGLRGEITSHWNWEGAYVYSRNTLDQTQSNLIYASNLPLATNHGFLPACCAAAARETSDKIIDALIVANLTFPISFISTDSG